MKYLLVLMSFLVWNHPLLGKEPLFTCKTVSASQQGLLKVFSDKGATFIFRQQGKKEHHCSLVASSALNEPTGVVPGYFLNLLVKECTPSVGELDILSMLRIRGKWLDDNRSEMNLQWLPTEDSSPCEEMKFDRKRLVEFLSGFRERKRKP